MEIYIKIVFDGGSAWYNEIDKECYLIDGEYLIDYDCPYGEHLRGTPFKSVKDAKSAAKMALNISIFDGDSNPKITYWRYVRGKLTRTYFTKDNKIKRKVKK